METPKKEDLRVRRTRKMLVQALFVLLEHEEFQAISVKQICDEAMIHRTTFYTHFNDKYNLMSYGLKDIVDEFQFANGTLQENQIKLFRLSTKYKALFSQLLTEDKNSLRYKILKEMNQSAEDSLKIESKADEVSSEIAVAALSNATIGVINWWLTRGEGTSELDIQEEMKKIFNWDYIERFYPEVTSEK